MPRRAVLSYEKRAALLTLPDDDTLLIQHWTLSQDDLAVIVRRRRPHNREGFAIQLCKLRYPERLLRPGEMIPQDPLAFVSEQLQRLDVLVGQEFGKLVTPIDWQDRGDHIQFFGASKCCVVGKRITGHNLSVTLLGLE